MKPFLALLALLTLPHVTHAGTVTQTFAIPQQKTTWIEPIDIPRFDPALGKLTGISVEFDKHVRWSMQLTVTNATAQNWYVDGLMKASVLTTFEYQNGTDILTKLYREPDFEVFLDQRATLPATLMQTGIVDLHAETSIPAGDFALWVGSGSIPLTLHSVGASWHTATTWIQIPGSVSWYMQWTQSVSVAGEVTYEYAP